MKNTFPYTTDSDLNLFYTRDVDIAETLILAIPNHLKSIECATRALHHCELVGQPNPRIFWGYDGTDKKTIKTPEHLKNNAAMQLLKIMDTGLSITEVACFLSHIAAWMHCIKINKPVVILEHDSIMLRAFTKINSNNCLEYLGHIADLANEIRIHNTEVLSKYLLSNEHQSTTFKKQLTLPLMQMVNANYLLILGLHNYAIDPIMAKNLVSYIIKYGIVNPADAIIEQHEFTLIQTGTYAVQGIDSEDTTTIGNTVNSRKDTFTIPGVTI
jgi:GR25 family glycosyltransferase involved in LPS biosynthesis